MKRPNRDRKRLIRGGAGGGGFVRNKPENLCKILLTVLTIC